MGALATGLIWSKTTVLSKPVALNYSGGGLLVTDGVVVLRSSWPKRLLVLSDVMGLWLLSWVFS